MNPRPCEEHRTSKSLDPRMREPSLDPSYPLSYPQIPTIKDHKDSFRGWGMIKP